MRRLGPTIRILRTVQELTVLDLSAKTGMSHQFLYNLEAGIRSPSLETLDKIAEALGINSALLLFISDLEDPINKGIMPMVYMHVYNTIVPKGAIWTYP